MIKAIEMIEAATNEATAQSYLDGWRTQVDFISGRVLAPTYFDGWRAQGFFEDCGHNMPLPDGCHRRLVPQSLLEAAR